VVVLDWTLKTIRARILDSLSCAVDQRLAQQVFEHLLHVQLDATAVVVKGTLNSVPSGYEAKTVDQTWKDAVAPQSHIPLASERSVPQFLTRGTNDRLISDAAVKEFTDALVKAGQRVEYVQVGGANHAFFDWKPDERTQATFAKYGVYYAAGMKAFFTSVLY